MKVSNLTAALADARATDMQLQTYGQAEGLRNYELRRCCGRD